MEISQSDIAQLTDMQLRHMVTGAANLGYSGEPGGIFYLRIAAALGRARRERHRRFLVAEADFMNDDGPALS